MNIQTQRLLAEIEAATPGEISFADAVSLALNKDTAGGIMGRTYYYPSEPMAEAAGRAFLREAWRQGEGAGSSGRRPDRDYKHRVYGQVYAAFFFDY